MKLLIHIAVTAGALLLVAHYMPGIDVEGVTPALIAALLLGILNALVRPILVLLTLPITVLTLGLFIFCINAVLFLVVAAFVDGFTVSGFWVALFGSLLVSVVSTLINKVIA